MYKTSPFKADRNHLHHRILSLGLNHKEVTAVLVFINKLLMVLAFGIVNLETHVQLFSLIICGSLLFGLPFVVKNKSGT